VDYQELLHRYDSHTHWECPPDFAYREAQSRFNQFVADLSAALGVEIGADTNGSIQDASFHSQIFVPLPAGRLALVRFSYFGDMVTVSDDEPVPEEMLQLLQQLFAQHRYVYVPAAVLSTPYTGIAPGIGGIDTWWIRYFDWL
jgi:hypothetical protein